MNDDYLLKKRLQVLETIKPICEVFGITDYDYEVDVEKDNEQLRIYNTRIGCNSNSIDAIKQELVGYIFIKTWSQRTLGAFDKQSRNVIKRYWLE